MKKSIIFPTLLASIIILNSCKKEFDSPPLKTPNAAAQTNIKRIKAKVSSSSSIFKFTSDSSLFCTVIADETSGNIFKQVFVQDSAGDAIQLDLTDAGGLSVGDKIRINLNGIYALNSNNMISLDSVSVGKSIVKQSSGNVVTPIVVSSISMITSAMQSKLVTILGVEFNGSDKNATYADAIGKGSLNRNLVPCGQGSPLLVVRSSGYASFAAQLTPSGSGEVTAIVTQYQTTMQLILRDIKEVKLNSTSCSTVGAVTPTLPAGTYLFKDFEDNSITSIGWTNSNVVGTVNWGIATAGTKVAQCNNFIGTGNQPACETWFISPGIDLTASTAPSFSFQSAGNTFSGPTMEVYVSTNYVGGAPTTATWIMLTPTLNTAATFVNSGLLNFNAYKTTNVRVAFKYPGNLGSGRRWQIDNIRIGE